jgi:hypothetical protein
MPTLVVVELKTSWFKIVGSVLIVKTRPLSIEHNEGPKNVKPFLAGAAIAVSIVPQ